MKNNLIDRTKQFSLSIIDLVEVLPTSIAPTTIAKMNIVLE
jgi:hypothetical protein